MHRLQWLLSSVFALLFLPLTDLLLNLDFVISGQFSLLASSEWTLFLPFDLPITARLLCYSQLLHYFSMVFEDTYDLLRNSQSQIVHKFYLRVFMFIHTLKRFPSPYFLILFKKKNYKQLIILVGCKIQNLFDFQMQHVLLLYLNKNWRIQWVEI